MQIENNDHARELIAAAGINTITVTTRQLKSLHKHVDACMRASGNYNGTYRMNKVGTDPRYCTCSTEQWESREAFSFNRDGFIGFAGWADKSNKYRTSIPRSVAPCKAGLSGYKHSHRRNRRSRYRIVRSSNIEAVLRR